MTWVGNQGGVVSDTPAGNDLPSAYGELTDEALQPARDLIAFFLIAMKTYALYPEDNETSKRSVINVATRLNEFFENHGNFRFDVKRDRLVFRGVAIHEGTPHVEDMAFILFRNGIQWMEFQKEIELPEVAGFFRLLNQYRETPEESEGDLVTALWEVQFPHLRYEASDILLEDETIVDFSLLNVMNEAHRGGDQEEEEEILQAIADPDANTAMWELSPQEIDELRETVQADENRDSMEEVLDLMIVIFREHVVEEDLEDLVKFLLAEFQDALSRVQFKVALTLLERLHEIYGSCKTTKPWAIGILDNFFKEISTYRVLSILQEAWPVLEILDSHRLLLRKILGLLSPEAIGAIGLMLSEVSSPNIRRELTKAIGALARKDMAPLERLLNHPNQNLVQRIVPVLKELDGDRPSEILLMLVRSSPEPVKKRALDTLIARDPQRLKEVFPVIEDGSDPIRMLMLQYLGNDRNELAEALLLDYIKQRQFKRQDRQHLLDCYSSLGRCGSARSIPFLRGALLDQGWVPGFWRSTHRQGATIALMALGLDEAEALLDKASRSLFPSVRIACKKAMGLSR